MPVAALAGCAVLAPLAIAGPAGAASTSTTSSSIAFTAGAYGTYATLGVSGATAGSSPSAPAGFVSAMTPQNLTNSTASVNIPALNTSAGAITDTVSSTGTGGSVTSATAQLTTASVNILGGLIKASAVTQKATAAYASGAWSANSMSTLTGLTIAGKSVAANPAPNSTVNLAGIGTVYLNFQSKSVSATNASIDSDAIVVQVTTANSLNIPIGSLILVGHAAVTGTGSLSGALTGTAYGTSLTGGSSPRAPHSRPRCPLPGSRPRSRTTAQGSLRAS